MEYYVHNQKLGFLLYLSNPQQPGRPDALWSSLRQSSILNQVHNTFPQRLPTDMSALLVSKEMRQKIRQKANIDEDRIKEGVQTLKEWLESQPHLPHDYDDARMETLFKRCKASIEKCKRTIDMYYTLRSAVPEILCNRDPYEPWFKQVTSIGCCVPLQELTEDYERVTILTYLSQDTSKISGYDFYKMVMMIVDIRTIEDYSLSDIFIFDFENFTAADVVKYTLPVLKKIYVITFQGIKGRLKAIHFINTPPIVDTIADIMRRLMKPKLAARLHVHRKGSDSLLKTISPRILPKEYGGDAGSLLDHWDVWKKKIESYRDWFLEQEKSKVDESKRPDKSFNTSDLFGFEGTFRQLNVD